MVSALLVPPDEAPYQSRRPRAGCRSQNARKSTGRPRRSSRGARRSPRFTRSIAGTAKRKRSPSIQRSSAVVPPGPSRIIRSERGGSTATAPRADSTRPVCGSRSVSEMRSVRALGSIPARSFRAYAHSACVGAARTGAWGTAAGAQPASAAATQSTPRRPHHHSARTSSTAYPRSGATPSTSALRTSPAAIAATAAAAAKPPAPSWSPARAATERLGTSTQGEPASTARTRASSRPQKTANLVGRRRPRHVGRGARPRATTPTTPPSRARGRPAAPPPLPPPTRARSRPRCAGRGRRFRSRWARGSARSRGSPPPRCPRRSRPPPPPRTAPRRSRSRSRPSRRGRPWRGRARGAPGRSRRAPPARRGRGWESRRGSRAGGPCRRPGA